MLYMASEDMAKTTARRAIRDLVKELNAMMQNSYSNLAEEMRYATVSPE